MQITVKHHKVKISIAPEVNIGAQEQANETKCIVINIK